MLEKIAAALDAGLPARSVALTEEQEEYAKSLFLLDEKARALRRQHRRGRDRPRPGRPAHGQGRARGRPARGRGGPRHLRPPSRRSWRSWRDEERKEYLQELGLPASGLDRLVQTSYRLLGLISYLTAGPKEVRAWTITKGMTAPQAAGKIHSDFERGFIRAEVVSFDALVENGSMAALQGEGPGPAPRARTTSSRTATSCSSASTFDAQEKARGACAPRFFCRKGGRNMRREELLRLVEARYGVAADYPFARDGESAVLRHPAGGKWFAPAHDRAARAAGPARGGARGRAQPQGRPAARGPPCGGSRAFCPPTT